MCKMERRTSVLVLLSMIAACHGLYSGSGPVLSLSKKTFKSQILESDLPAVVEFYAPWCGHCQQLAPVYTKVANNLQVRLSQLLLLLQRLRSPPACRRIMKYLAASCAGHGNSSCNRLR